MSGVLYVGRAVGNGEPIALEVAGGSVARVRAPTPDELARAGARLPWIAPGFVDVQVNGYLGHDYSGAALVEDDVRAIIAGLARSGTTRHMPTLITLPRERIVANLRTLARLAAEEPEIDAAFAGFHVEGPFISFDDGPRGAHAREWVREPDIDELAAWQEAAEGRLAYVTIAPERRGALGFIEQARRRGVRVAIGHTAAPPELIRDAISAGATIGTHVGNGCHLMLPRHRNHLWELLAADALAAGLICDGYHLPDPFIKVAARAKPAGALFLVSDCAPCGGLAPGRYEWLGTRVEVHPDGHLGIPDTEFLAGAGHLLDRGLARFMKATGWELARAVELVTEAPLRAVLGKESAAAPRGGAQSRALGVPAAGARADLTLFDFEPGDEQIVVRLTVGSGRLLYERPAG